MQHQKWESDKPDFIKMKNSIQRGKDGPQEDFVIHLFDKKLLSKILKDLSIALSVAQW